ncbi:hypothetical protein KIN20_004114 [Parelaphostrongylus tenuis]|uniref:Uncharacterized protein n=1 Tax=Parelaphostrongylus tenuis TaxID=148309 RepID=A0AAD5MGJ8_PARTN|nr:hypothetical protein KIN20_004114 [Parelaphostrongylus tenuis]
MTNLAETRQTLKSAVQGNQLANVSIEICKDDRERSKALGLQYPMEICAMIKCQEQNKDIMDSEGHHE